MKILITGGAGFLGSNISKRLVENGHEISVMDSIRKDKMTEDFISSLGSRINIFEANILSKEDIEKIFSNRFDAVIHLAGKSDVRESVREIEVFEDINVRGTLNVLEACRRHGVKKFIFASSSSVYGDQKKEKFSEKDNTDNHASPYGATKKIGEILCSLYNKIYGLDTVALRFFTAYGPRGRLNMAVMRFIKSVDEGSAVEIHGDGKILRDFVYVDDVVDAVEACLSKNLGFDVINIGSGKTTQLNYLIDIVQREVGKKAEISYVPMQKGDVFSTCADIKKAELMLNWTPKTSIEEGVKKTVAWWKKGGKKLYD